VVTVTDDRVRSIQGERESQLAGPVLMEIADVDKYVDGVTDEVLACRERGRHLFPSIREGGITFVDVTEDGLFVRRLLCTCCRLAQRVELWEGTGRGKNTRFVPVSASVTYLRGPRGERYLGPQGRGRMTPKMVRNSLASRALQGQSLSELRKQARHRVRRLQAVD
jgi:hypothetical protein